MAKKAKKRLHPMPPLGWQDLLLYWSAMTATFGGMLACMIYPINYRQKFAFSDRNINEP